MKTLKAILLLIFTFSTISAQTVSSELKVWHKVIIDFEGPFTSEKVKPNPFTDYRLDVNFESPSGQQFTVPGYYAADGNSSETSADSGNIWRVLFTPNESGIWSYKANFVFGEDVAAELSGGESAGFFDGHLGEFTVLENDNNDTLDFRSKGKLVYVGEHYLQFSGSKEFFLKGGLNSPEVFLEYTEFDNTPSSTTYSTHLPDWNEGDPTWKDGKGKGIIGSINYLSNLNQNVFYFLTMNSYGDGKKAWPWIHHDSTRVYDCSKLDQWGILFDHMITKGMMPHFVLTETENESLFELTDQRGPGGFAKSRKIYFREMVARFGYLCAVTWNVGEENGWAEGTGYHTANTDEQRKLFAERLRELTYYNDHVTVHNGPSNDDSIYESLLENRSITGPALQWNYGPTIHGKVLEWRNKSSDSGYNWVVSMDEPYIGSATGPYGTWRKEMVWGTFMAGGAGIELYIGAGKDLSVDNFKTYRVFYENTQIALNFFKKNIPYWEMEPDDEFAENAWSLIKPDSTYLLYLKNGGTTSVKLPEGYYNVRWFDPRNGGELVEGTVKQILSDSLTSIGFAPTDQNEDWACLITRTDTITTGVRQGNLIPNDIYLKQNYPNPFNPTTTISFGINRGGKINLSIYNVMGELINNLINEYYTAGNYSIDWNGTNYHGNLVSSGIYLCNLATSEIEITNKMILTK